MTLKSLLVGAAVVGFALSFATPSHALLDHYKCYKIKKEINPFPPTVVLFDQFVATDQVTVIKPFFWCNPTQKLSPPGPPIINNVDHLLCYKLKGNKLDPAVHIATTNQFGVSTLFAKKPFLLCVPGSKAIIP